MTIDNSTFHQQAEALVKAEAIQKGRTTEAGFEHWKNTNQEVHTYTLRLKALELKTAASAPAVVNTSDLRKAITVVEAGGFIGKDGSASIGTNVFKVQKLIDSHEAIAKANPKGGRFRENSPNTVIDLTTGAVLTRRAAARIGFVETTEAAR